MFKNLFKNSKPEPENIIAAAPEVVQVQEVVDNRELIAVITACLSQCMNVATDGLVIRSIRKVPLWTMQNRLRGK